MRLFPNVEEVPGGSQPNSSPASKPQPTKKQKTLETGMGSIVQRPNIGYLAMPLTELRKMDTYQHMVDTCDLSQTADAVMCLPFDERHRLMIKTLPQRSDLWSD